jgi:hypothetical protein
MTDERTSPMSRRVTAKTNRSAPRRRGAELRACVVGMPELHAPIDAGLVRGEIHVALSARGLGPVAIELGADEEIVARAPLSIEGDRGTCVEGEAILIAKREALPREKLTADDPRLPGLARVLVREAARS